MWEESLGTQAGVHLIQGVCLIWGPLNTGFTVFGQTALVIFLTDNKRGNRRSIESTVKINQSEGIAAPAKPEEGR